MDAHEIKCVLADVPKQFTVDWSTTAWTTAMGTMSVDQGSQAGTSQTSTLTLSGTQLAALKAIGSNHVFTCKILVGNVQMRVTATQTTTIYTPGSFWRQTFLTAILILANVHHYQFRFFF